MASPSVSASPEQGVRAGHTRGFNVRAGNTPLCNIHQAQDFVLRLWQLRDRCVWGGLGWGEVGTLQGTERHRERRRGQAVGTVGGGPEEERGTDWGSGQREKVEKTAPSVEGGTGPDDIREVMPWGAGMFRCWEDSGMGQGGASGPLLCPLARLLETARAVSLRPAEGAMPTHLGTLDSLEALQEEEAEERTGSGPSCSGHSLAPGALSWALPSAHVPSLNAARSLLGHGSGT